MRLNKNKTTRCASPTSSTLRLRDMGKDPNEDTRIAAFEMKCLRRILDIKWEEKVSNEKIRAKIQSTAQQRPAKHSESSKNQTSSMVLSRNTNG